MRVALGAAVLALTLAPGVGAVEYRADARVDLLGLVQLLSGERLFGRFPWDPAPQGYAQEALRRFAPWRTHPAARRIKAMRRFGFSGLLPSQYAVYLSSPPGLREIWPAPSLFVNAAGGRAELDSFLAELRDFAKSTGFLEWRASLTATAALESALRDAAGNRDLEEALARVLGARSWDKWTVAASPFFPEQWGASWIVEEKPGKPDIWVVLGPRWENVRPRFGPPEEFAVNVWREGAYSAAYLIHEDRRPRRSAPRACPPGGLGDAGCLQDAWVEAVLERALAGEFGPEQARRYRAKVRGGREDAASTTLKRARRRF